METIGKRGTQQESWLGTLSRKTIERYVGERSFRLGEDYVDSKAIFGCQRQGDLLKGCCRGRSADHYTLSLSLKAGQIVNADCSCPVGAGGQCKHIAALLLTALKSPQEFVETAPLEKRLAECDKPKLIQLITQMIEQEPDLESWLELALPTAMPSPATVKPGLYRRKAAAAFASAGYGWEADRQLTAALSSLQKIGDQFLQRKNALSAAAVYCGILEGFVSEYETFQDETGNVTSVAQECIESLGKCLPELAEGSKDREPVVRTLFDVLRFDINFGGIGLSDDVPEILTQQTNPAERAVIVGWIRGEKLDGDDEITSKWRRGAWGGLLLDLEGEPDDDDAYLRHCREFGLTGGLVERLLDRGRLDDALREIHSSSDYDLMGHADRLIAHKQADLAHTLVRERLSSSKHGRNNWQLRDWLKRFHQSRKNWPSMLQLCVDDFRGQPTLEGYQEIRKLSQKLKTWKSLGPELISGVPQDSAELIRIHLDEGNVGLAIQLLESRAAKRKVGGFDWDRVDLEVAKAAEKSHPDTALKTYRAETERLIAGRGRGNYQSACEYIKKARGLFQVLGRQDDWRTYLTTLRDQHRSVRAFQEELARAGL